MSRLCVSGCLQFSLKVTHPVKIAQSVCCSWATCLCLSPLAVGATVVSDCPCIHPYVRACVQKVSELNLRFWYTWATMNRVDFEVTGSKVKVTTIYGHKRWTCMCQQLSVKLCPVSHWSNSVFLQHVAKLALQALYMPRKSLCQSVTPWYYVKMRVAQCLQLSDAVGPVWAAEL